MCSLFGNPASKRTRLSEQDHLRAIERGRGVEFHLQNVEFDNDDIPGEVVEFPTHVSSLFLSPDGMVVFMVLSCDSRVDCMDTLTQRHFIVHHSLTDGQGSYFPIPKFNDINSSGHMHFYALSNDRLGALFIDKSCSIVNQYVIRIGHRPRLAEVAARRSFPIDNSYSWYGETSLQLDDRIMVSNELSPILILAADIEAPESKKYCHCCRLNGYSSRLEIEAQNHNVSRPSFEALTLGRNGVYVCVRFRNDTQSFGVLGLEWQRNNELPADLCHRRAKDTVPVFYRFNQPFVTINSRSSFQVTSNGLVIFTRHGVLLCGGKQPPVLTTQKVFVLDLTRLVNGDAHPEIRCTQYTISFPVYGSSLFKRLNRVPGTSSIIVQFGHPSILLRLRSAFDVPPLRQLAFEAVYRHMKPEERSKPGWMQTLCGFECT